MAPLPVRVIALLLVGFLPMQVGLSGLLGAAAQSHDHPAEEVGAGVDVQAPLEGGDAEGHDHPADCDRPADYDPPADRHYPEGHHAAATLLATEAGSAHGSEEPCGASGLCNTGLMTCSDGAPCATVAFFPSAPDLPAARTSMSAPSSPAVSIREDEPFAAKTPPPRA